MRGLRPDRMLLLASGIPLLLISLAWGADKTSSDPQVSIVPRPKPAAEATDVPRGNIRVDSTLVLIPVTVTDPLNRFVTGLEKENFRIFEDKSEQLVSQFSSEDAPLSVGIVFDCSGSMGDKLENRARRWRNFSRRPIRKTSSFWWSSTTAPNWS